MRTPLILAALFSQALFGCYAAPQEPSPHDTSAPPRSSGEEAQSPKPTAERGGEAALQLFRDEGVEGALVVTAVGSGAVTVVNPAMADKGFLPASTFKIPNTLIGLSSGVLPDEHFTLKWDGKPHKGIPEWDADHDLTSAMRNSVVWFYQEVARRVGQTRMQDSLTRFRYGNATMGAPVDMFWLRGALRITPREQVDFLQRLAKGELPVSAEHAALVRRILANETHEQTTIRWKTGLGEQDGIHVGWFVGFLERAGTTSVFASVMTGSDQEKVKRARVRAPRKALGRLGLISAPLAESTRWK